GIRLPFFNCKLQMANCKLLTKSLRDLNVLWLPCGGLFVLFALRARKVKLLGFLPRNDVARLRLAVMPLR
ncbi:MAG: hypothetical protein IKX98_02715, partial [Clostridia bacterium]|nr:hypothetical protein [Clostridia bacterium]